MLLLKYFYMYSNIVATQLYKIYIFVYCGFRDSTKVFGKNNHISLSETQNVHIEILGVFICLNYYRKTNLNASPKIHTGGGASYTVKQGRFYTLCL